MRVEKNDHLTGCCLCSSHSGFYQTLSAFIFNQLNFRTERFNYKLPEWLIKLRKRAVVVNQNYFMQKVFWRSIEDRINTSQENTFYLVVETNNDGSVWKFLIVFLSLTPRSFYEKLSSAILLFLKIA